VVRIVGMAEGGGAVLVEDDAVVAWSPQPGAGVPWAALERCLHDVGWGRDSVDAIALAGAYKPLLLRKRPLLEQLASAPLSPIRAVSSAWQALARRTGAGAFAADVTAEWLAEEAAQRGLSPRRTAMVDVQHALAEAGYRLQPWDEAVILGLHPHGDGAALAVHVARAGQIDQTFIQPGFEALHAHLDRMLQALGLPVGGLRSLGMLAAGAAPDEALRSLLAGELAAEPPGLSRSAWWPASRGDDPLLRRLRELPRTVAAASVSANLLDAIVAVAEHHLALHGIDHLILVGDIAEDPWRVAALTARLSVGRITVPPSPGAIAAAFGAACDEAGLSPRAMDWRVASPPERPRSPVPTGRQEGWLPRLLAGEPVVRWREASGVDPVGLGERAVLVLAEDAGAVDDVRRRLGRPRHEPTTVLLPASSVEGLGGSARDALAWGGVAVALPPALEACAGGDGRAPVIAVEASRQPTLAAMLESLRGRAKVPALAAFPVAEGESAGALVLEDALKVWARLGRGAFLGPSGLWERDR
jgi:hypothetical protein